MATYIISWTVFNVLDVQVSSGKTKVKNAENELIAKIKLESYLKKKYNTFNYVIMDSCEKDFDIPDSFKDIFGEKI